MKTITKYISDDGFEFLSEVKCMDHEKLVLKVKEIMSVLKPVPMDENCNFANDKGYIQQNRSSVEKAMTDIIHLANIPEDLKLNALSCPFNYRHSVIGRYLDDSDSQLRSAWNRFMCIDMFFREWGQQYYALHPEKGKNFEINGGDI